MGIEGRVAKILNTREIIINRGSQDGVGSDMEFAILEPPVAVVDPVTEECLGQLEREKIRVRIFEVYPRFSLARTYEVYQELNPDAIIPGLARSFSPYVKKVRRINTQRTHVDLEGVANVTVGDLAAQLPEHNFTLGDKEGQ